MASIPEAELRDELRSLAWKLFRHPQARDMTEFGAYSPQTYQNRYGSWQAALEAAGIADLTAPILDDDDILEALHDVVATIETAPPPTLADIVDHGAYSPVLYLDRFDSWLAALRTAGFETRARTDPKSVTATDNTLQTALQQTATIIHQTPTAEEMDRYGDYQSAVYRDRFGSWDAAVEAASLAPPAESRQVRYSDAELRTHLRELADDLGQPPTTGEMNTVDGPTALTYQYRFGSWTAALEAVGLEPPTTGSTAISDDELVAELQALADDLGSTPTRQAMLDRGAYAPTTYARRFGSWNAAVRAAGLTPNAESRE